MADNHINNGPFDVPDVRNFVPRRLKPWLFIFFVLIIQLSGGVYLAAASDMMGTTALMQQDILMAGYASLVGMSINFAVMFRIKFRFAVRTQLLACGAVLIAANFICAHTDSMPVLVATCFVAGWFRMQGTFACNSTIQLWLTPVRDMSIFFCYVYLVVDGTIQLSGLATVYTAFFAQWEFMPWIMMGLLALMMVVVLVLLKPMHFPMHIPLLGIDWLGAILWTGFMLCTTFVCVYGNYFDWWEASEICIASLLGLACLALNLWRATFLHHPYISFQTLTNSNVVKAICVYLVFFVLMATEHVFEHSYAANVLGFDETNLIDLNGYVLAGIISGVLFTYFTFALRKWRYKTMTAIGFFMGALYLAWFYFFIDYGVEKEALFVPLYLRGFAMVTISITYLTSILQGGLPFLIFPQALAVNGYVSAVLVGTLGSAIVGELLNHAVADNFALLSSTMTASDPVVAHMPLGDLYGMTQLQALVVSMKEIYGLLLIVAIVSLILIAVSYSSVRPQAIFPKWRTIRKVYNRVAKAFAKARTAKAG